MLDRELTSGQHSPRQATFAPQLPALSPSSPSIELKPGVPFCGVSELNRIARQQGLCLAIAQAVVFDQIAQGVVLDSQLEQDLVRSYLERQDIGDDSSLELYLLEKGWDHADLLYFATKGKRLDVFKQSVFQEEVEIRFLERKLDFDQVEYSMIRVADEGLAFELYQRLLEAEADFAELAELYSEGPERRSQGRIGPVSLTQAHPIVAEKLRISQPGQLWQPLFLVNIWLILRLDRWEGARLDDEMREELLNELFYDWLQQRSMQLLAGETPSPLPLHMLS